jgi:predicted amidohydrolase YtcJ
MCIGCHWATFRNLNLGRAGSGSGGLTRRRVLQYGAASAGTALVAGTAAPSFTADAAAATDGDADIVFRNGPVYTVNADNPWARAVAIKDRRITYVGDEAGVQPFIGPRTRVVELAGKMLLPGFVEGHIHPLVGSTLTRGVELQYDTREEILDALRAYRAKIGQVDIVRGFGWRYFAFPSSGPRKEDLDALWPDVPVILFAIDGHCAWVNSQALALAGVTRDTKDPLPGFSYFERDPTTGEPTGYLVEVPVIVQVNNAVEPFSPDYVAGGLAEWLPKAAAAGITTVFEAGMQVVSDIEGFGIYSSFERAGKLPFRVVGSYYHNNPAIDPVPVIQALRREFQSELVQASVLKLNIDGGDAQRTAALLAPYSDAPGTSGDTLLPPELFADIIRRADREGIDIHVHSYGDRATRLSLDAIEAAVKANPPRDRRHALAHILLVAPEDVPRFGELGVVAQFSAQWAVPDRTWRDITGMRLGTQRGNELYSIKSILAHGGVASFGTDWPAAGHYSTYRPLDAIEVAITRRELGKPDSPQLQPISETVTLDAALRANTIGPAHQLRMEHKVGSIEAGKLADLVVLEKNLFDVLPHEIHKIDVLMTVMNGRVTHERNA